VPPTTAQRGGARSLRSKCTWPNTVFNDIIVHALDKVSRFSGRCKHKQRARQWIALAIKPERRHSALEDLVRKKVYDAFSNICSQAQALISLRFYGRLLGLFLCESHAREDADCSDAREENDKRQIVVARNPSGPKQDETDDEI